MDPLGSASADAALLASQAAIEVLLAVGYDGGCFVGYQQQAGQRSVEGTLLEALRCVLVEAGGDAATYHHTPPLTLASSSRTDAGVHARDLVVKTSAIPVAGR
jgi:tRNA pseudouridine(38-40) synthase